MAAIERWLDLNSMEIKLPILSKANSLIDVVQPCFCFVTTRSLLTFRGIYKYWANYSIKRYWTYFPSISEETPVTSPWLNLVIGDLILGTSHKCFSIFIYFISLSRTLIMSDKHANLTGSYLMKFFLIRCSFTFLLFNFDKLKAGS